MTYFKERCFKISILFFLLPLSSLPAHAHPDHSDGSEYFYFSSSNPSPNAEHTHPNGSAIWHGETEIDVCNDYADWYGDNTDNTNVVAVPGNVEDGNAHPGSGLVPGFDNSQNGDGIGATKHITVECNIEFVNPLGQEDSTHPTFSLYCDDLDANDELKTKLGTCVAKSEKPTCTAGNPIGIEDGIKRQYDTDWISPLDGRFRFERSYSANFQWQDSTKALFGHGWSAPYFARIQSENSNHWRILLGGDEIIEFRRSYVAFQEVITSDTPDSDLRFQPNVLIFPDGKKYHFTSISPTNALYVVSKITWPDGYQIDFEWTSGALPTAIEDNRGQRAEISANQIEIDLNYDAVSFVPDVTIDYSYLERVHRPNGLVRITEYFLDEAHVFNTATSATLNKYQYEYNLYPNSTELGRIRDGRVDGTGQNIAYAEFTYSALGRATSSTHPGNADLTQVSAPVSVSNGVQVTVTNALNKETQYTFETIAGRQRPVSIDGVATTSCLPSNTAMSYDSNGRVSERIERNGAKTTYTRDSFGRILTKTEDADGLDPRVTIYTWPTSNLRKPLTRTTSELKETFTYDADGLLTSYSQEDVLSGSPDFGKIRTTTYSYTTLASGLKVMTSLDGPGLLANGVNDVTNFEYDALGRLTKTTDPNGLMTEVLSFDVTGLPSLIRDSRSFEWALEYDLEGQLTKSTFQPNGVNDVTTYTYDIIGQMVASKDSLNREWEYTYDEARRLVEIESPTGDLITFEHDAMGNVTRTANANAAGIEAYIAETQYDELGRILQTLGSNGQTTDFSHDVEDNLATVTDATSAQTIYTYDALNRMTALADRASYTTTMDHDESDQITLYTDPRSIQTQFVYNGFGELLSEVSADRGTMSYVYNDRGLPTSYTDARGVVTNYTYDDAGRILSKTFPSDSLLDQTFTYYAATAPNAFDRGLLKQINHQAGYSTLRSHTTRGEIRQNNHRIDNIWYKSQSWPTREFQVDQLLYPSGSRLKHNYDADGNLTQLRWRAKDPVTGAFAPWQDVVTNMDYAPLGPLTSMIYADGGVMTATYDTSYRLTGLADVRLGQTLRDETYSWTTRDNLAGVTDNLTPAQNQSFGYTSREKLASADGPWGEFDYSYDGVGNRTSMTTLAGGTTNLDVYGYPTTNNQLQSVTFGAGGVRSLTYDAMGNVTFDNRNGPAYSYNYDAAGRMSSFAINGVIQSEYEYNHLGQQVVRRLTQLQQTIHSVHDVEGKRIAEYLFDETAGTSSLIREYIWANDMLVGVFENGQMYFVRTDHIGRPVFATDSAGTKVWEASYLPFGGVQTSSGPNSELRFPGQWFQAEAGLHQNWMRDYDPTTGRYMQADPLGLVDGASVYGYALQNPGKYYDPTGQYCLPCAILAGAVLAEGFYQAYQFGYNLGRYGFEFECWEVAPSDFLSGLAPGPDVVRAIRKGDGVIPRWLKERGNSGKPAGDLTPEEVAQIQDVVDEAGRPLEVVGSAANGTRRNVGSNLPIGKGDGTRSDIDILIPPASLDNFKGLQNRFPTGTDVNPGTANPHIGPSIRFEPRY